MSLVCARLGVRVPDFVRHDVLRVSHTCKASPSGTGFTFTLRVRNAHDDRESIPWLSRVEARVGSETTFATLDRQPFTLKRTIRDDGDVETKVEVELTFYFQRARDAASPPARRVYDASYANGGTTIRYSFETYRKSYAEAHSP